MARRPLGSRRQIHAKVDLAPYLKATDAERIYAKISDIPDVSGFISIQTYNLLLARVVQLETKMTTVNTKLDSIPEILQMTNASMLCRMGSGLK